MTNRPGHRSGEEGVSRRGALATIAALVGVGGLAWLGLKGPEVRRALRIKEEIEAIKQEIDDLKTDIEGGNFKEVVLLNPRGYAEKIDAIAAKTSQVITLLKELKTTGYGPSQDQTESAIAELNMVLEKFNSFPVVTSQAAIEVSDRIENIACDGVGGFLGGKAEKFCRGARGRVERTVRMHTGIDLEGARKLIGESLKRLEAEVISLKQELGTFL